MPKIKQVIERLFPLGSNPSAQGDVRFIPVWPPDVFAVTATLVEQSGCYSRISADGWDVGGLFSQEGYHKDIARLAEAWRNMRLVDAKDGARVMPEAAQELQELWKRLLDMGDEPVNGAGRRWQSWWEPAIKLLAIADDAAGRIGTVEPESSDDCFADFYLQQYQLIYSKPEKQSSGDDTNTAGGAAATPKRSPLLAICREACA